MWPDNEAASIRPSGSDCDRENWIHNSCGCVLFFSFRAWPVAYRDSLWQQQGLNYGCGELVNVLVLVARRRTVDQLVSPVGQTLRVLAGHWSCLIKLYTSACVTCARCSVCVCQSSGYICTRSASFRLFIPVGPSAGRTFFFPKLSKIIFAATLIGSPWVGASRCLSSKLIVSEYRSTYSGLTVVCSRRPGSLDTVYKIKCNSIMF
jgi:hypothetical protein